MALVSGGCKAHGHMADGLEDPKKVFVFDFFAFDVSERGKRKST